ncbi:Hemolysin family protein [Candidatus Hepatincolaceae symbiont of Richtersius coronifer]
MPEDDSKKALRNLFNKYFNFKKLSLKKTNLESNRQENYDYDKLVNLIKDYDKNSETHNISEHSLISNVIFLRDKRAQDIAMPRIDIVAVRDDIDIQEILNVIQKSGHSRLPVFKDNLDNVTGFIHVKDLIPILNKQGPLVIDTILRQIIFISPYMNLLDLLYEMKTRRIHMALVVDEFGGVDGLITMEDVMEEIVGDITDEYDKVPLNMIESILPGVLEADARIELDELEKQTGSFVSTEEKEEFNTVAGLIVSLAGYIPSKNELILHPSGVEFKILSADPVKVNKVCVYYDKLIPKLRKP